MPSSLSTIKTMEKNIDIITLGKKIGKIEISTSHMNEQLKEESNKRMILEKKTDKMAENISSELSIVKTGFDSISLMFKEGLDKMKKSIMEEVDFKTSSILKIVKDSVNKIDQFETSKNIENFELYKTEVDNLNKKANIEKEELAIRRIDESPVKNLGYFLIKGILNRLGLNFHLDLLDKIEKEAISTYDYLLNIVSARIVTLSSNDNILPLFNVSNFEYR